MKKSIFFVAALALLAVSCNKGGKDPEPKIFDTITYGGLEYRTLTLSNGQTWMVDPLCYVPDGMTVSDDPAKAKDICYPYEFISIQKAPVEVMDTVKFAHQETIEGKKVTVNDSLKTIKPKTSNYTSTLAVVKDDAKVRKQGLLYSWKTVFGVELTADNYNKMEGAQGICPDGWHIPSNAEWKDLIGYITGDTDVKTDAIFYDAEYEGGNLKKMNAANWLFTPAGTVAAGKYGTTWISQVTSLQFGRYDKVTIYDPYSKGQRTVLKGEEPAYSEWVGGPILTYIASSTGYQWTDKSQQMDAAMTNFSGGCTYMAITAGAKNYPQGKIHVAHSNIANACVSVRCVKDTK